jgi:CxxC motif-containing protein
MSTTLTHYLCIGCPLGCRLEVEEDDGQHIVEVRGFSCKRGKDYALQEHTDPRRMVTTTVRVSGGLWARLPVKTTAPIPKQRVRELCRVLRPITVTTPVRLGDVILQNALGTGVDVVATRDLPEVTEREREEETNRLVLS